MLRAVGESPISTLTDPFTDAQIAINLLEEVSREVQSKGYRFNTECDVTLSKGGDGTIPVSSNVLDARPHLKSKVRGEGNWALRGGFLYDLENHTNVFTASERADIIYMLDWPDLTEPVRRYITVRAARKFQEDMLGSAEKGKFKDTDEADALRDFRRSDRRSRRANMFVDNIRLHNTTNRNTPNRSR